jgi:signal transduction histidine kinase
MTSLNRGHSRAVPFALLLGVLVGVELRSQDAMILTNVQQVIALGMEGARTSSAPARLRGVVTYTNSKREHFYFQDATAGIIIPLRDASLCPEFGQEVEVEGNSGASGSQIWVEASAVRVLGPGRLPEPRRSGLTEATESRHFAQWVEVEGTVLQIRTNHLSGATVLHLAGESGWTMAAVIGPIPEFADQQYWGAKVRVRGLNAGGTAAAVLAAKPSLCTVLARGSRDPFDAPATNAAALLRTGVASAGRVKLQAVVLDVPHDGAVFLRDANTAFQTDFLYPFDPNDKESRPLRRLTIPILRRGDVVEVVGLTASTNLRLRYSLFRVLRPGEEPEPVQTNLAAVISGRVANNLVTVRGRLIDQQHFNLGSRGYELLKLRSGSAVLDAVLDSTKTGPPLSLAIDDMIEATGLVQPDGNSPGFRLRMRSVSDARSLGVAPEVMRTRRLQGAGIAAALVFAAALWILFLRQKLARERQLAVERARADSAVRELNTALEHRVAERTAELEKAREKLDRALAAERELSELKSRFVSLVSHEFRTPLGITMSAVELLRNYIDRLPPEKLKELLHDIYSSTLRMSGLMEQVLVLGRVEAGNLGYQPLPLDIEVLGSKLVDEALSATNRKCPVQFFTSGDLSGARGDESMLRHICSNLLSNAVKYSNECGAVEFAIRRVNGEAEFTVRDHGLGIPRQDQARLFEAFYRASNVSQISGTGLGLLIVKRCVDSHHGTISFESTVGTGTTFTVRLPLFGK